MSCQQSNDEKKKADGNAPEAVKEAFQAKYPGENDPDWHQDAHGNYEANFKQKGEKYRADFAENGVRRDSFVMVPNGPCPSDFLRTSRELRESIARSGASLTGTSDEFLSVHRLCPAGQGSA